ncbi:MAG: transposase [Cytophagaceae bacterium]|nr:MAG: transposase [Cytophagaceae bacterium]
MNRHALKDAEWTKISAFLPPSIGRPPKLGTTNFVDAVVFSACTSVPWRDLPEMFENWKTVYNRFSTWSRKGAWQQIFDEILTTRQDRISLMDSSVVCAHQDASGGSLGPKKTLSVARKKGPRRKSILSWIQKESQYRRL